MVLVLGLLLFGISLCLLQDLVEAVCNLFTQIPIEAGLSIQKPRLCGFGHLPFGVRVQGARLDPALYNLKHRDMISSPVCLKVSVLRTPRPHPPPMLVFRAW